MMCADKTCSAPQAPETKRGPRRSFVCAPLTGSLRQPPEAERPAGPAGRQRRRGSRCADSKGRLSSTSWAVPFCHSKCREAALWGEVEGSHLAVPSRGP
jgi:hypothetical protein